MFVYIVSVVSPTIKLITIHNTSTRARPHHHHHHHCESVSCRIGQMNSMEIQLKSCGRQSFEIDASKWMWCVRLWVCFRGNIERNYCKWVGGLTHACNHSTFILHILHLTHLPYISATLARFTLAYNSSLAHARECTT